MSSVDVVVPCYNYSRFLEQCVDSILGQVGVDVRVLIIDDASSDDTSHVGKRLAAYDKRVEFRQHDVNQGHIATYNEGLLGWASAEYSLLISADDALAPGALARATQLMDCHSELGITYGMALIVTDNDGPTEITETVSNDYRIVSGSQFLRFCCAKCVNPVPTPTAIVRTELQHHLGGYRADFPHTGDLEMWMRFAAHTSVGVLRAVQGYYRWHGANMGSRYYNRMLGDRRDFAQTCEYVLAPLSAQFPECGLWLKLMYQRMAEQALRSASEAFNEGDTTQCRTWLEFAEEISPNLRLSPNLRRSGRWWYLQAKRLLGQALWHRVHPALNRLRGIGETIEPPEALLRPQWARRSGQQIGGWPEPI